MLNGVANKGAIAMTGFFMLSGFTNMYQADQHTDKSFFIKRIVAIVPLYYFCSILYIVIRGEESLVQNFLLIPMEALGLQSLFPNTFGISHNGGTWFVSVILIAYALFPLLREKIQRICDRQATIFCIIILMVLTIYFPFMAHAFQLGTLYSNPFIRVMEFSIGMMLAYLHEQSNATYKRKPFCASLVFLIVAAQFCGITYIYHYEVNDYLLYNIVVIPSFALLLLILSNIEVNYNPIVSYLSSLSYSFFMAQLFIWSIMKHFEEYIDLSNNIMRIMVSFIVCFLIAFILHEGIEKPAKRVVMKGIEK